MFCPIEQFRTLKPPGIILLLYDYITDWDYSKSTASSAKNIKVFTLQVYTKQKASLCTQNRKLGSAHKTEQVASTHTKHSATYETKKLLVHTQNSGAHKTENLEVHKKQKKLPGHTKQKTATVRKTSLGRLSNPAPIALKLTLNKSRML